MTQADIQRMMADHYQLNKIVLGMMKGDLDWKITTKYFALRTKMYSYRRL